MRHEFTTHPGRNTEMVRQYHFGAPQDVADILDSVEGMKSKYICDAIRLKHAVEIAKGLQ